MLLKASSETHLYSRDLAVNLDEITYVPDLTLLTEVGWKVTFVNFSFIEKGSLLAFSES